jgi:predicted metal-binding membrane protein
MAVALAPFLGSWTVMMAAMMLPSAMPMILLHRRGFVGPARVQSEIRTGVFVGAYVLVWAATGVGVWIAARLVDAFLPMAARPFGVAAILLFAGVYEFTPAKSTCLRVCRSPIDFLMTHWHRGLAGEFRLGLEHGVYCLGCCWALMAVFVGAGGMGLLWAAIIALAVLVQKVWSQGLVFGRVIGAMLIGGAVLVAALPQLALSMAGSM